MGSVDIPPPSTPAAGARVASGTAGGGAPKRDRIAGFSILFVAFAAALVISWKSSEAVRPNVAAEPAPPTTEGLQGHPAAVDPLATLALARTFSERNQLRRIVATGVAPDGTVDFGQPGASLRYDFDSAAGEGPEPPRPPGTVRHGTYCGRQSVKVTPKGIAAEPDQPRAACRSASGEPLPEPRCTPQRLWALARERKPGVDGRATLEYFRAQGGPAWRFSLPGAQLSFTMFGDCERELEGRDARPLAP